MIYLGLFCSSNILARKTLNKISSRSAGQEVSHFLRKPQIRHRVHKSKSLFPMASQQVISHRPFCNFNVRLSSILRSSMWPLLISFYDSNPVLTFPSSDARYVTHLLTAVHIEGIQITSAPISVIGNPSDTSSLSVTIIIRSTSPDILNGNSFVTRGQAPY